MEGKIRKIDAYEPLLAEEDVSISDEKKQEVAAVTAESTSAMRSVPGNPAFSAKKSACPEKPLSARNASVVTEEEDVAPKSLDGASTPIPDENKRLDPYVDLARDILDHPERRKGFMYEGRRLGKKSAKAKLKFALKNFGDASLDPDSADFKHLEDIKYAFDSVSKKLRKARVVKGIKIGSALVTAGAAIAGTVLTCGVAAPFAVPAAIASITSLAETINDSGKNIIAVLEKEDKKAADASLESPKADRNSEADHESLEE
ncbi:MAG: hypothetical protein LBJ94_01710 [Puniceicoccales bacterium]|jgi:hypothetical protein|nr:hypothetical protein [Puniceicoccales bacterium]